MAAPDFEQVIGLSETGLMIYFHKSKQQTVLLLPYFCPFNPAYLVIRYFSLEKSCLGKVRFFKKTLKRKRNVTKLQNCFTTSISRFSPEIFFQSMKKVSPAVFYRACTMVWPVYCVRHVAIPLI